MIIRLSASSKEQLRTVCERLLIFLEEVVYHDGLLQNIAYTLQTGRERMEERLAIETVSLEELKDKLRLFIKEGVMQGANFDWDKMDDYGDGPRPRRISLPGYPFLKEYYGPIQETSVVRSFETGVSTRLHPLVHCNNSTFLRQTFRSLFNGGEFFLKDHRINGQRVLPGVAYLEMVHAALCMSIDFRDDMGKGFGLQHVAWIQPITVADSPVAVEIDLKPAEGERVAFEIHSDKMHSQGSAYLFEKREVPFLDIGVISGRIGIEKYPADNCYKAFDTLGTCYGPAYRTIDYIQSNGEEALASLTIRPVAGEGVGDFWLHPGLMDALFQSVMGMEVLGRENNQAPSILALPFALREMKVFDKCTEQMWVYVRRDKKNRSSFDMDLCDESGRVCVEMRGYVYKELTKARGLDGVLYLRPSWQTAEKPLQRIEPGIAAHVVLCEERLMPTDKGAVDVRWLSLLPDGTGATDQAVHVFGIVKQLLAGIGNRRVLLQVLLSVDHWHLLAETIGSLLRTAHMENPQFSGQMILVDQGLASAGIVQCIRENSVVPEETEIRYTQGYREVRRLLECDLPAEAAHPWKEGAVYLITGGMGGLGIILAKDIASRTKMATLILAGRSIPDEKKTALLEDLRREGIIVEYRQADITDANATRRMVDGVLQDFGKLDYVIHCAGIHRDNFILRKTEEDVCKVMAPKVSGLVNLDLATKDAVLEHFILFSSISVSGNTGQADYAMANAFMDGYAKYRNSLVRAGERSGRATAINWPMWKEGGMHVDPRIQSIMSGTIGMQALSTEDGIAALYAVMASAHEQVMVVQGNLRLLRQTFLEQPAAMEVPASRAIVETPASAAIVETPASTVPELPVELRERAVHYLKKILAGTIQLSFSRIEAEASFDKYGIDSLMMVRMTNELEKAFGILPKTLFFEYNNINELTRYFQESHAEKLRTILCGSTAAIKQERVVSAGPQEKMAALIPQKRRCRLWLPKWI